MNAYDLGETVRSSVNIQVSAADVDPAALTVSVRDPQGQVTLYTYGTDAAVIKDSVGDYHIDVTCDLPGVWKVRWRGTGSNLGARESSWRINDSDFRGRP
jgi:hypothetical protein